MAAGPEAAIAHEIENRIVGATGEGGFQVQTLRPDMKATQRPTKRTFSTLKANGGSARAIRAHLTPMVFWN